MDFYQKSRKIFSFFKSRKNIFLVFFIAFFILFFGRTVLADTYTDVWDDYWNMTSTCPGSYSSGSCNSCSSGTCGSQSATSCGTWGPTYCSNSNVYRQRNCYNSNYYGGSYTNSYVETQVFQYCTANQVCQGGQCQAACDCSTGPCCDGCHYKSAIVSCNFETEAEYSCPWGTSCGSDVGKRTKTRIQYCSGTSAVCNGNWGPWSAFGSWQIADACSASQICSVGNSQCQNAPACFVPTYIKYFKKSCFENDLYWFDSNNAKQDKYKTCDDNNQCTTDACQGSVCLNELKCDSSTCSQESEDYCKSCTHCGDNKCNCGETIETCYNDCKVLSGLPISILAKTEGESVQWFKNLSLKSKEKIDFLLVVSNNEKDAFNNVIVKTDFPKEIIYQGDLKIDGSPLSGNIQEGINIGSLSSKSLRTITFKAQAVESKNFDRNEAEVVATIQTANSSGNDSIKLAFEKAPLNLAAAGSVLSSIFKSWFWLAVLGTVLIAWFTFRMIYIWFFKKT